MTSEYATQSKFSTKVPECVANKCYEYKGIIHPYFFPARYLDSLPDFEVRPDDVFVITWPKSGTTWMLNVCTLIQNDGDDSCLEGSHLAFKTAFLEVVTDLNNVETSPTFGEIAATLPSPRILKTHCVPRLLPKDIRPEDPKAKVIYVVRNPKDAAVSYYHHCLYLKPLPTYESWDQFFEEFIVGRMVQGSWFENVLPWWKSRDHPNVFFVSYEDMSKDLEKVVRDISRFMGKPLRDDVIRRIVSASSFDSMKKNKSTNPDFILDGKLRDENRSFLRKGVVGDWKNYFTREQSDRFGELYKRELAGTNLELQFEI